MHGFTVHYVIGGIMKNVILACVVLIAAAAFAGERGGDKNPAPTPKEPDQKQGDMGPMWTCHKLRGDDKYINCEKFAYACDSEEKSGTYLYTNKEDVTESVNCERAGFLRATFYCKGELPANGREIGEIGGRMGKGQESCEKEHDGKDQDKEIPQK